MQYSGIFPGTVFTNMREQHLHEVLQLLVVGFTQHNEVWMSFKPDQREIYNFFRNILVEHLEDQKLFREKSGRNVFFNLIYLFNGKIVAVDFSRDYHEYLKKATKKKSIFPDYDRLEQAGKVLLSSLRPQNFEKDKNIYHSFCVMDPSVMGSHISVCFCSDVLLYFLKEGFHNFIARSTNPKSHGILVYAGGKSYAKYNFENQGNIFELNFDVLKLADSPQNVMKALMKRTASKMVKQTRQAPREVAKL